MSLRDQLLQKGLVSKKQAQQAKRELKKARKQQQGARQKKKVVERETAAARQAREAAELEARQKRRLERDEAKDQVERVLRIRNLVRGNRVRVGGKQPFWHHTVDGRHLLRMHVSLSAAEQLRQGGLAIAGFDHGNRVEYFVVKGEAARKLRELGANSVVFLVDDMKGISSPEEQFLRRDWETDLRPHRKR